MNEPIKLIYSREAEEIYQYLKKKAPISKTERMLFHAIQQKEICIKISMPYGNPLAKKLFPQEYKIKYDITNLFRVELSLFWRMLYTLIEKDGEIIAFILDIIDHKTYDKKFGYRKK